jgi:folate-binding protein YgfZ
MLLVEGEDAASFLQGQTTCDIKSLPEGCITLGGICNAKGRTVAVFRLFHADGHCFLLLRADMIDAVRKRLKPYVMRSRVRIAGADLDPDWRLSGLLGTLAPVTIEALGISAAPQPGHAFRTAAGAWLLGIDQDRKYLLLAPSDLTATVRAALLDSGAAEAVPTATWHSAEIADGIPSITPATTEEFIPQMLNLDLLGGISFRKGCYTGQEVVARTHYLGSVKRRMHRFRVTCDRFPEAGARLSNANDADIGLVLHAAPPEENPRDFDLLAVLTGEGAQTDDIRLWSSTGPRVEHISLPYSL